MKSYTTGRNLYGSLTKNTASANLTLGDQIANDDYRAICAAKDWPFLERSRTRTTTASTQAYNLPYDCDQVRSVSVTVSSTTYVPKEAPSLAFWDELNETSVTSDIPEWYIIFAGQIKLWPTPATSSNTITFNQKTRVIDLSVADYTTGTIVTATAGSAAIVGSGTSWTDQMTGRWMRITYSDTDNTGDGLWYEISSVTDATHLTLVRLYGGNSISAGGAAYTIGQMPLLPEAYHDLPWIYATGQYWMKEADPRGQAYIEQHGSFGEYGSAPTGRIATLVRTESSPTTNMVLDDGGDNGIINPNLTISL